MKKPSAKTRPTVVSNDDINIQDVLKLEKSLEPCETQHGIEFLKKHGNLIGLMSSGNLFGIAESITLDGLLASGAKKQILALPEESPLRAIVEKEQKRSHLLTQIRDSYPGRTNYHYGHGIVVQPRGIGVGTRLFFEMLKRIIGPEDLMFGYILAEPVNIPSLRLYFKNGAVVDRIEKDVYGDDKPYFRAVYDPKSSYSDERIKVPLGASYLAKMEGHLTAGFVGSRIDKEGYLVFRRKL